MVVSVAAIVAQTLRESPRLPASYAVLGKSEKTVLLWRARREGRTPEAVYETVKRERDDKLDALDRNEELAAVAAKVKRIR